MSFSELNQDVMAQQRLLFGNLQKGKTYLIGVLANPETGNDWLNNTAGPQLIYASSANENARMATAKTELKAIIEAAGYGLAGLTAQLNAMFSWSYSTFADMAASDTAMTAISSSEEAMGSIVKIDPAVEAIAKSALALNRIAKGTRANQFAGSTYNAAYRDQALATCIAGTSYFTNKPVAAKTLSATLSTTGAMSASNYHDISANTWGTAMPAQNAIYFPKRYTANGSGSSVFLMTAYLSAFCGSLGFTFDFSTAPTSVRPVNTFGFGSLGLVLGLATSQQGGASGSSAVSAWSGTSSAEGVAFQAI
jgi:hypothetical protein